MAGNREESTRMLKTLLYDRELKREEDQRRRQTEKQELRRAEECARQEAERMAILRGEKIENASFKVFKVNRTSSLCIKSISGIVLGTDCEVIVDEACPVTILSTTFSEELATLMSG